MADDFLIRRGDRLSEGNRISGVHLHLFGIDIHVLAEGFVRVE